MEDQFKEDDEITLAGMARLEAELYGARKNPPGLWARIKAFFAGLFGQK